MKLKNILLESKKEQMMRQLTREEKSGIMDSVAKFNDFGSRVYKTDEIKEMVRAIKEMTAGAANLALQETDDWFDSVTVKRDMKEVANSVKLFEKTAHEMSQMQQRLESVYEDMGHKLGKYYDIQDVVDKGDMDGDGVDEPDEDEYMDAKDKAIKKAMNEKDKGDMDGDGVDEPDEDEYMDSKDAAIKKAMKLETIMQEDYSTMKLKSNIAQKWGSSKDMQKDLRQWFEAAYQGGGYDLIDDIVSALEVELRLYKQYRKQARRR
tara:strand:+ start:16071 stop:16862 length:792 start_codon:yes stop_codon:yes gene_type:complete